MKAKQFYLAAARWRLASLCGTGLAVLLPWLVAAQTRDFGDAPSPYPTTLKDSGAWHVVSGPRLGKLVDGESDGQPDAAALGDDLRPVGAADDEDGVVFIQSLVPGQTVQIQVEASGSFDLALLDAWIDFGTDGSWAETGDQIFNKQRLLQGLNVLTFAVPKEAKVGATYARFRVSQQGGLGFKDGASDGEVEDYQVNIASGSLDFGDAPAPYPTTRKDNGAFHAPGGVRLGFLLDTEDDGQPDLDALGDDKNPAGTSSDEDGITFLTPLVPGQSAQVQVVATGSFDIARLDAWVDFGADGSWADSGDQIFASQAVNQGTNVLLFAVPSAAKVTTTFARFRLSLQGKLDYVGSAEGGEVEDYKVAVTEQQLDFGDAPAPYPTTLKDNGARHVPGSVRLGLLIDTEQDGQPDAGALGDDKNPSTADDEDGILFLTSLVPGQIAQVQVVASGNFDRALLDAWVDFGADGSWATAGDQIFGGQAVNQGTNVLNFSVPTTAKIGSTFARFRISLQGKLGFVGEAQGGEVEDYQVQISPPLLDFGDALGKYPTLLSQDGARHAFTNNFCLGYFVDGETDGQPDANALGDDLNPAGVPDDEDGVTFVTTLEPGKSATIQIRLTAPGATAPGSGRLNAWVDFNHNESWADAGEQIFTNLLIYAGVTTTNFIVPASAGLGATYARFRLNHQGGLSPAGAASDGEVEDYQVNIQQLLDFGDAPAPYPTLLADDGARHDYVRDVNLGFRVDLEADGQPTTAANGDDLNPSTADDEDGVVFTSALVQGRLATLTVIASRQGLLLHAWLDFNANGSWADAGEKIYSGLVLANGTNYLSFIVPADAKPTRTYARFRVTTQTGAVNYVGRVSDGEVEDYVVSIIRERDRCDLGCAGREFWLTFPGNYAPDLDNPTKPSLCVQGAPGVSGVVSIAALGFSKNFTLPASGTARLPLPKAADLGDLNDAVTNTGIHVVTSDDVSITALNHALFTTDSYQALHAATLGTAYVVLGFGNLQPEGIPLNGSQFAVVATESNTRVMITPSVTTGVRPANVPYILVLQAGDAYQLRNTNGALSDLTGTIIRSDKPIAVFGSHLCANIPSASLWYCDYLVEQLPSVNTWGNDFYTAPLATRSGGDTLRILAAYTSTDVFVNGVFLATLNRAESKQITLGAGARITTTRPALVAQYANSSDYDGVVNSDPFMLLVQATRHYNTSYRLCTPTNDFPANYVHLVVPTADVGGIILDGAAVGAGAFTAIGGTVYSYARVSVAPGQHTVYGRSPFAASVYGWAERDSYGHPGCFYFGDVQPPQVTPETPSITASVASYPNSPGQAPVPSIVGGATVSDNCSPELGRPTQSIKAGTLLSPGVYELTLNLEDDNGNIGETNVTFTVIDPSPVTIVCPSNMTVNCTGGQGAVVQFNVTAHTTYETNVAVVSTPPSGSVFPPGTTVVTNVATSLAGLSQTCYFTVSVVCDARITAVVGRNQLNLTWPGTATLEYSSNVSGPWQAISTGAGSYSAPLTGARGFFRVRY